MLVFKTSWRRVQHVFSATILRLPRGLEHVLKTFSRPLARRLQDVFKTTWKTKKCYAEDVFKTSWRHALKTSWRHVLKTSWRHILKTPSRRLGSKAKPVYLWSNRICIFTQKFTLGKFSVPAWANQPHRFSVRGTSTPNGLFQTIKILMCYTKRLHQTSCIVPFKIRKSWTFC